MQVPLGHAVVDGKLVPDDWWTITTGPIVRLRWPHMLLAAFLTTGMSVIATGAWYLPRRTYSEEGRVMLRWGIGLVAVIIPVQMFFGHLTGEYVLHYQPAKFAAIEARWQTQQPASEVLIAIPDEAAQRNLLAIEVPRLGSFIASGTWDAREIGLDTFPPEDRPRARMTGNLFLDRPWGFIFPAVGLLAMYGVFAAVRRRRDAWPFALTAVFFLAALLSLAVMFWPYMIPYTITVGNAAAPEKSLSFLFWGAGVFVLPVIAIYTALVYWLFRGKLRKGYG